MKKVIITMLAVLLATFSWAQGKGSDTAKMRKFVELRNTIITEKLALTEKEQADFLPVYNEYTEKEHQLRNDIRKILKKTTVKTYTEEEANKILAELAKLEKDRASLFETYMEKFKTVLPSTKVLKLYAVEREIQRTLMKKVKEAKQKK